MATKTKDSTVIYSYIATIVSDNIYQIKPHILYALF